MKLKGIPPVKMVMTPFPYCVEASATVDRADGMMREHDVRHLPVTDNGALISVLRQEDVSRARTEGGESRVADILHGDAYVVELSEPLDVVLAQMADRHIDSALVVKDGRLAGIFTVTDGCRYFSELLRTLFPRGSGDDAA